MSYGIRKREITTTKLFHAAKLPLPKKSLPKGSMCLLNSFQSNNLISSSHPSQANTQIIQLRKYQTDFPLTYFKLDTKKKKIL